MFYHNNNNKLSSPKRIINFTGCHTLLQGIYVVNSKKLLTNSMRKGNTYSDRLNIDKII